MKATVREIARDKMSLIAAVAFPVAAAAQFVGHRSVLEIVLSLAVIAVCGAMISWSLYRTATGRIADRADAAEHAQWLTEHDAERARIRANRAA